MKSKTISIIKCEKIIVIARKVPKEQIIPLAEALYAGGVRLLEVTFDQGGEYDDLYIAEEINELNREFEGRMLIGAGTVMTTKQVELAHSAGAKYIISPNVCDEVITKTIEYGMVSIPGAVTPSEIEAAKRFGADIVKLFPAGEFGISYIKSILAPMCHIKMMAVGGVNAENLKEFLNIGLVGVGIGANIVKKELLENGDFEGITTLAKAYTTLVSKGE